MSTLAPRVRAHILAWQAPVIGTYAWAVTVLPVALVRPGLGYTKVLAALALVSLALGHVAEQRRMPRAKFLAFWSVCVASLATWVLGQADLEKHPLDMLRVVLGSTGWGLYAFTFCAPTIPVTTDLTRIKVGPPLSPRKPLLRSDKIVVALAIFAAVALQTIGHQTASLERSVLVRILSIALGIVLLGGATSLVLARYGSRVPQRSGESVRRAWLWLLLTFLLGLVGLGLHLSRTSP